MDEHSFTEYTRSRYGDTLYRLFFKPYTEKFLQIPCEEVHVDWAKTGINRAVIDKRVRSESLFDLVRTVLLAHARGDEVPLSELRRVRDVLRKARCRGWASSAERSSSRAP